MSEELQLTSSSSLGPHSNLCIDGGYDLCAEIYNKGILSPLAALIPQVSLLELRRCRASAVLTTLPPLLQITTTLNGIFTAAPLDLKKDLVEIRKRKLVYDLSENVLTILWCLSCVAPFTSENARDLG